MRILNSNLEDIPVILELYQKATELMKFKQQVVWPTFSKHLVATEINEKRQWKLLIEDKIACIWATTLSDELIWGENNDQAVYIHRITTNSIFQGRGLLKQIVNWADLYGLDNKFQSIRMDTVGLNHGLIRHYQKNGFTFLGTKSIEDTNGLPDHYKEGPICLFERKLNDSN